LPPEHFSWAIIVEEDQVWLTEQISQKLGWMSLKACYFLFPEHKGGGLDPLLEPAHSSGCPPGMFAPGETLTLTARPAASWAVAAWQGTDDDGSKEEVNTVTMPAADHTATVFYFRHRYYLPLVVR
jgi:hypothetical protein